MKELSPLIDLKVTYAKFVALKLKMADTIQSAYDANEPNSERGIAMFNKFAEYMSLYRNRIAEENGYIANVFVRKEIEIKQPDIEPSPSVRVFSPTSPVRIAELINIRLNNLFPNGVALDLKTLPAKDKFELSVFTDKSILINVVSAINKNKSLRGKLTAFEFLPIEPDNQFICGISSIKEAEEFLELNDPDYGRSHAVGNSPDFDM